MGEVVNPEDHPEVVPPYRVTPFGPSWSPIFVAYDLDHWDAFPERVRFGLSPRAARRRHARSLLRTMKRDQRRKRRSLTNGAPASEEASER